MLRLDGKVALVTGSSKGLGRAIARGLCEQGATVILSARNPDELRESLAEVTAGVPNAHGTFVVADLSKPGAADELGKAALACYGKVDILINNAGMGWHATVTEITDENLMYTLQTNLVSAIQLTRALAPSMIERGWGRVVNLSSVYGLEGHNGRTSYSSSKHALLGATKTQSLELGAHGVTVNAIVPGVFVTDMVRNRFPDEAARSKMGKNLPIGRFSEPHELAATAVLLCSEAGASYNGSTLVVDGGITAGRGKVGLDLPSKP